MTESSAGNDQARRRWLILGVVYVCMLAFAMTLQSVPPILSLVMADLGLSHTQAGLLMSFFALPGIVISIPAGMLADRYNQKVIGIASLALMVSGMAVTASGNSLATLALGRVIAGIGGMTLAVMLPQMVAQWFAGREVGTAMGIFNTGMPLGTIISLNLLPVLAVSQGWRASIWVAAGVSLLAIAALGLLFKPAPRGDAPEQPRRSSLWRDIRLAGMPIWLVGVIWMLFNAAVISLFTFTPDLLTSNGFTPASAGFHTSLVMAPSLLLSPMVGYAMDRTGRKVAILATGGVALAALVVWVPTAIGWILPLMLLLGVAQAMVPAPVFSLPADLVSPQRLGLSFGIISTCLNIGVVAGPVAVGLVKDVTGSYQTSYGLMTGWAAMFVVVAIILARVRRRSTPDLTEM